MLSVYLTVELPSEFKTDLLWFKRGDSRHICMLFVNEAWISGGKVFLLDPVNFLLDFQKSSPQA